MEEYDVIDAGVDYLTCTGSASGSALVLDQYASEYLREKRDAGETIRPASRFGFSGLRSDHFFTGLNDHGSIVIVSGAECGPLANDLILRSDNVSRIDLQVTLWCGGEQPHLGCELNSRTRAYLSQHKSRSTCGVRVEYPRGETFTFNKRVSDFHARVYDKATQGKLGPARTVWRYEIELKRKPALAAAYTLLRQSCPATWTTHRVHQLLTARHVDCAFKPDGAPQPGDLQIFRAQSDRLGWFRNQVSHSISKAIKRDGLPATLDALGLAHLLTANANDPEGHNE